MAQRRSHLRINSVSGALRSKGENAYCSSVTANTGNRAVLKQVANPR
jgi:hypothetical protein